MVRSELMAYLSGSQMQDSDEIKVLLSDGTYHAIVNITRDGAAQTTLPPVVEPVTAPEIIITLA